MLNLEFFRPVEKCPFWIAKWYAWIKNRPLCGHGRQLIAREKKSGRMTDDQLNQGLQAALNGDQSAIASSRRIIALVSGQGPATGVFGTLPPTPTSSSFAPGVYSLPSTAG